jgi:hypothetical protein
MSIPSDPYAAFMLGLMLIGLAFLLPMLIWPPRIQAPKPPKPKMTPVPILADVEVEARQRSLHAQRLQSPRRRSPQAPRR